jgi:hypothetical protein
LNDEAVEGQFVWSSHEPVTYQNWYPGNPQGGFSDEDYVGKILDFGGIAPNNLGKWHDIVGDGRLSNVNFGVVEVDSKPDIEVTSASTADSQGVDFEFEARGGSLGRIPFGLYRSADTRFDPDVDVALGNITIPGVIPGLNHGHWTGPLPIDPTHKYVLVVADPSDTIAEDDRDPFNEDNAASFRKYVIGVVTHGLLPLGYPQSVFSDWVGPMAASLKAAPVNYDDSIAFNWSSLSRVPLPGITTFEGLSLAALVRAHAQQLGVGSNDAIDVHFIGHSRGAVVIGIAAWALNVHAGMSQLQAGFTRMTMLDPHPANPATASWYSAPNERLAGALLSAFSLAANDPFAIVPSNVDQAEVFYQNTPWYRAADFISRRLINLWGVVPVFGGGRVTYRDLTNEVPGIGHITLTDWYKVHIVPTLGGPSPTTIQTLGDPLPATHQKSPSGVNGLLVSTNPARGQLISVLTPNDFGTKKKRSSMQ